MSFMLRSKFDFGRKGSRTGSFSQLRLGQNLPLFSVIRGVVTLPLLKFVILLSFDF
jgi:hypothetical protein